MTYNTLYRTNPLIHKRTAKPAVDDRPSLPINLLEGKNYFKIEIAAPGRNKEDFSLELKDHKLWVRSSGEQPNPVEDKYTYREFKKVSFEKAFTLSNRINKEQIAANYENGILSITLPLVAPRTIEIA